MKISPIIKMLRERCPSFEQRIGGTADLPAAEEATAMALPCAFVLAPKDEPEEPREQRYVQNVPITFEIELYTSARSDERGLDAYDAVDDLKREVIKALAGYTPDDCDDWCAYSGGEVTSLNRDCLSYRMTFSCGYVIRDGESRHGVDIDSLPPFLRMHADVKGTNGDPSSKTPAIKMDINLEE